MMATHEPHDTMSKVMIEIDRRKNAVIESICEQRPHLQPDRLRQASLQNLQHLLSTIKEYDRLMTAYTV